MLNKIKHFLFLTAVNIKRHRIIHSLKTAFACLLGVIFEKFFAWSTGQWIPITIMKTSAPEVKKLLLSK